MSSHLIGIDVGGTFTDFVLLEDGEIRVHKSPTTPEDQSRAIVAGLTEMELLDEGREEGRPLTKVEPLSTSALTVRASIVHGTTVATNALLERRGARTALLATEGFGDVIEIGRQNRPNLYKLHQQRPPQLVPPALRFEVRERIDVRGNILASLDAEALDEVLERLLGADPESVAVSFLFSYQNSKHERQVAKRLHSRCPDLLVSLSSDVLPEYREYERTSTTVINAYVRPLVHRYLHRLRSVLPDSTIRIMQSNGGAIGADQASEQPARLVLSGPAGGVVGAFSLAQKAMAGKHPALDDSVEDSPRIITLDMGGTSTDVALCPGRILRTSESEIGGLPLRLPVIDIHTVGAGGGSLAYVDPGGSLRVGPQSAGAVPGPVCYGRGGSEPTVTDANLVLGRLDPGQFLGGTDSMGLDTEAAMDALARLGDELGGFSAKEAALGVVRVANATMERALRRVSVERGYDPKEFVLVPFGGAGPLHACELAEALGIRRILLPPTPGVLSALGLLMADVVHENAQAVLQDADVLVSNPSLLGEAYSSLAAANRTVLEEEGISEPRLEASLDMRYHGQSYELTVSLPAPDSHLRGQSSPPAVSETPIRQASIREAVKSFHQLHVQRYGYAMVSEPVEVVTLRLQGIGKGAEPDLRWERPGSHDPGQAYLDTQPVWFERGGPRDTGRYDRSGLEPGNRFDGPAIVYQFDTTVVAAPNWQAEVDGWRNLWLLRRTEME